VVDLWVRIISHAVKRKEGNRAGKIIHIDRYSLLSRPYRCYFEVWLLRKGEIVSRTYRYTISFAASSIRDLQVAIVSPALVDIFCAQLDVRSIFSFNLVPVTSRYQLQYPDSPASIHIHWAAGYYLDSKVFGSDLETLHIILNWYYCICICPGSRWSVQHCACDLPAANLPWSQYSWEEWRLGLLLVAKAGFWYGIAPVSLDHSDRVVSNLNDCLNIAIPNSKTWRMQLNNVIVR